MFNIKEYIEIFHLLFLQHLTIKLDKSMYALKGGCNLRFFFNSIRYSEDIDFDIRVIQKATLQNKINKLLTNSIFNNYLKSHNIAINNITEAKQTDTTQRWKLSLKIINIANNIPTKIEFSKRKDFNLATTNCVKIDSNITQKYKIHSIVANHYNIQAAFDQKINALINRTATQARDVFDLQLLIEAGVSKPKLNKELKLSTAIENLNNINFTDYKSQVVSYLLPEYLDYYSQETTWNNIKQQLEQFLLQ